MASILAILGVLHPALSGQETAPSRDVQLTIDTHHRTAQFDPRSALGAGLDGHWQGDELRMLSPANVRRMLLAGLGPISMRLRTEIAIDAWHWNPRGRWSDPLHHQGYWISDAQPKPGEPILATYGYKLPRRGDTVDQANDDGYSMLDDGDPATFWKSNPYLARPFTGEPDSQHPAWVVLDFGKPVPINAVRILWADPYATRLDVEYAHAGRVYGGGHPTGVWTVFDHGRDVRGTSGEQLVRLSDRPVRARYLRIWMTEGSGTAASGSADLRDRVGYAIREIGVGTLVPSGALHDEVTHAPGKGQTLAYVSSTDPWHRATDRDPKVEQPGIDLVFRSGITRGLPIMMAIPVLYDNPDNALALVAYAKLSGYSIGRYELGEEPEEEEIDPRDFAALYAPVARGIRKVVPKAVLGGPSVVTGDIDFSVLTWWLREFRRALARRGQSDDFRFLSFEWYPFDDVLGTEARQLREHGERLEDAITRLRRERLPLVLGEFNYSPFPTEHEVDLGGALLNAETAAQFLCHGGEAAFYYGYEPTKLEVTQGTWGNQTMLLQSKRGEAAVPVATFHTLRMLTNEWLDPNGGVHESFRVRTDLRKREQNLISAFALKRPDQAWSVLVINRDPTHAARLSVEGFSSAPGARDPAMLVTYSAAQYSWQADGPNGHPSRNDPPSRRTVRTEGPIVVPPWSVSVLRTR